MRHLSIFLSMLVPILFVAGCSGNGAAPGENASAPSTVPLVRSSRELGNAARMLHLRHTPLPLRHRHQPTSTERARALAGGWTPVTNTAPWTDGADSELLMTNGTVMVHDYCTSNWYALAPDKNGNYVRVRGRKRPRCPRIRAFVFRVGGPGRRQVDRQRRRVQLLP